MTEPTTPTPDQPDDRQPPASPQWPTAGQPGPAPTPGPAAMGKRLVRSRDDRMIAGVCGGLAQYLGIDPMIVRLAAVALTVFGGSGIILYLAGWLLIPEV